MNAHGGSRNGWTKGKAVMSTVTLLALLALTAALALVRPLPSLVDGSQRGSSAIERTVSQRLLATYCPARMTLADASQYGDTAFRASEGDIASASRYAAFGAVYSSTLATIGGDDKGELKDDDPTDEAAVRIMGGNADGGSLLQTTRLLEASDGNGVASSVASWASQGDLRGLAATSCAVPSSTHAFLLPATQTGWTQQLVIANTAAKATSVNVQVWGTGSSGRLGLSTSGTVSVNANGEAVMELSAAAGAQDGLFVTASSSDAPVSAVVRVVGMNGLTPQGNDYVTDAAAASDSSVIPGVGDADSVRALLYGAQAGGVTLSWVAADGTHEAKRIDLEAQRVAVVDLGRAPAGTVGLAVQADAPVNAAAVVVRNGDGGQSDFAVASAGTSAAVAAVAVPDQVSGTFHAANPADASADLTLDAFDAAGKPVGTKSVTVPAHASVSMPLTDVAPGVAALRVTDRSVVATWNVTLSRDALGQAKVGGTAVIAPSALTPMRATVRADAKPGVIG